MVALLTARGMVRVKLNMPRVHYIGENGLPIKDMAKRNIIIFLMVITITESFITVLCMEMVC